MEMYILIEHNNGIRGQRGFTDMTEAEMLAAYGTVDALIASYKASGIHVYSVSSSTH